MSVNGWMAQLKCGWLFGLVLRVCLLFDPHMLALVYNSFTTALFQFIKSALHPNCLLDLLVTILCVCDRYACSGAFLLCPTMSSACVTMYDRSSP